MSMDGMTMKDKCERLEPCGVMNESSNATTDSVQVCPSLHFAHVYVRRVIHMLLSTMVSPLLKVCLSLYTLLRSHFRNHLFVNCCIRRYCIYNKRASLSTACRAKMSSGVAKQRRSARQTPPTWRSASCPSSADGRHPAFH